MDVILTTSSTENNPVDTVYNEKTSNSNVEKNPLGTVNTGNGLLSNEPNVNVHTENTFQSHQPRPNLVEMVRAAELKKTTQNTGTS